MKISNNQIYVEEGLRSISSNLFRLEARLSPITFYAGVRKHGIICEP